MFYQNFWPQTDRNTTKSYTTYSKYLQFFKLKLSHTLNSKNCKQIKLPIFKIF